MNADLKAELSAATGGELTGRGALVSGSATGIGRSVVELLAAHGAFVGIHCRESIGDAEQVLAAVRETGGDGVIVQGDLANASDCVAIVDQFVAAAGRLDILVNNAGTPVDRARIEDCPLDLWRKVLDINLTGTFLITQRAIPYLRASGRGAIVNNLSLSVQTGGANGAGAYAVAKGGLQVLTRTLARELAPAVRTNAIMPGVIETRHHEQFTSAERMEQYRKETPLGRNGSSEEVAEAVLFLASDRSRFLNGALLDINGGRFLR